MEVTGNSITLQYHPAQKLVEVVWQQPVSEAEIQAGYDALREQLRLTCASRLLVDLRRRGPQLGNADEDWVAQEFCPLLLQAGAPVPRVAFVLTPDFYGYLQEQWHEQFCNDSELLRVAHFADPVAALQWLRGSN
ncbi:hypothetical protein GCM10027048_12780 [Hymenobacter coalescens]